MWVSVGAGLGRVSVGLLMAVSGPRGSCHLQVLHTTNTSLLWFEELSGAYPSFLEAERGGRMAGNEK